MTKKKTRYKSALPNTLVALACLAMFAASLWLFYRDLVFTSSRTDKDQVAQVTSKYRIAQRKYNDRVVWERLRQGSPLYNGDTIHTADMSNATVNFKSGLELEIDENSMVQILVGTDGTLRLSVSGGAISADTTNSSEDVLLDVGGTLINMRKGSRLSAALDESKEGAAVRLLAGGADIGGEGISAGDSVKVGRDGQVAKNRVTVTSVSENQKILLFGREESSVPLEWFPIDGSRMIVETSEKKDFSSIKDSFSLEDANKVELPASGPILYWRVYPEGGEEDAAQGRLSFEQVAPMEARQPQDGEVLSCYGESPSVSFSWEGNDFAQRYKVEVSADPDFSSIRGAGETSSQDMTLGGLDDGRYFWRVTPYYETNGIGWHGPSESRSFTIVRSESLPAPRLAFPPDGSSVSCDGGEFELDFSWKAENLGGGRNGGYTLQIARDRNFSDIIASERTSARNSRQTLSASDFPKGEYYWKVSQSYGGQEFESETRRFLVEEREAAQCRLLYPEDSYSVERERLGSLSFIWRLSDEGQKASLQFSKTEDFASVALEMETSASSISGASLEEGRYFWRVSSGGSASESRSLYVLGPFAAPQIVSPSAQERLLLDGAAAGRLNVRWKKAEGADTYTLRILDGQTGILIRELPGLSGQAASIPIEIPQKERKFVAQVQAFSGASRLAEARKSPVSEVRFSAREASPVRLVSPEPKKKFEGLSALKDGISLSWARGDDPCSSSELLLWRVGTGGRLSLVKSYKNPKEKVELERLSAGTYRWTVRASAKGGTPLDAREQRDFSVLEVPELPPPALDERWKDQDIGAEYLKGNRSISFSWSEVEGATGYDFSLYQKGADGSLRKIHSAEGTKDTEVTISDLKILDIGKFQWQVSAKSCAEDGFVLQKGKPAVQDFGIQFELPKDVEALDPGEVYGE